MEKSAWSAVRVTVRVTEVVIPSLNWAKAVKTKSNNRAVSLIFLDCATNVVEGGLVLCIGFGFAFGELQGRASAGRPQQTGLQIEQKLVAGVGDVEVAHGELADTVLRREHRLALLHGEPLGLVSEVGACGVENR